MQLKMQPNTRVPELNVYNKPMSDILFIGKDLPDSIDFAEGLASINRNVFTTTKDDSETENFAAENIFSATWNKTSAISARAFLIKAETKFTDINEYLLFFDSYYYSTKFELDRTEYIIKSLNFRVIINVAEALMIRPFKKKLKSLITSPTLNCKDSSVETKEKWLKLKS